MKKLLPIILSMSIISFSFIQCFSNNTEIPYAGIIGVSIVGLNYLTHHINSTAINQISQNNIDPKADNDAAIHKSHYSLGKTTKSINILGCSFIGFQILRYVYNYYTSR